MRWTDTLLGRAVVVAVTLAMVLAALVLVTRQDAHLGPLGMVFLLIGPGCLIVAALAEEARGWPSVVASVLALSLSVLVVVTVALGAAAVTLAPQSLGVAILLVVVLSGIAAAVRRRRPRLEASPPQRLVSRVGVALLGVALLIAGGATVLATVTAREARVPRFLQLYQDITQADGSDLFVMVRAVGLRGLRCSAAIFDRPPGGTARPVARWPDIVVESDLEWRAAVPRRVIGETGKAWVWVECVGADDRMERWIEVVG